MMFCFQFIFHLLDTSASSHYTQTYVQFGKQDDVGGKNSMKGLITSLLLGNVNGLITITIYLSLYHPPNFMVMTIGLKFVSTP